MSAPKSEVFWDAQPFRVPGVVVFCMILARTVYLFATRGALTTAMNDIEAEIGRLKGGAFDIESRLIQLHALHAQLDEARITPTGVLWTVMLSLVVLWVASMSEREWHNVKTWLRGVFS